VANWNLGSVADEIFNQIDDIPTSASGEPLLNIIDKKRIKSEKFLHATIGSTAIADQYQDPILLLSMSHVHKLIATQGGDKQHIKLGDLTVNTSSTSSTITMAMAMENDAMAQLKELKGRFHFFKALG